MRLFTLKELLAQTRSNGFAVGAFNFNNYEDAQAIVNAAISQNAPVILMASSGAIKYMGLHQLYHMVLGIAEVSTVPICLHLDHGTDVALIKKAIDIGFPSVMIDASRHAYADNIAITSEISHYAKDYNCSVEAELGKVGGKEEDIVVADNADVLTDSEDVIPFIQQTHIDALAVAIGTVHGFYKKEPNLDFARLEKIAGITDCPLVLHGGSGLTDDEFKKCISLGIQKVNVGTELKSGFSNALRQMSEKLSSDEFDPRCFMKPVKDAVTAIVEHKLQVFGSDGKAQLYIE